MRDALDNKLRHCLPCQLNEEDYHLYLCSLQVGIWEAGQKAHGTASDELFTNSIPRDDVQVWRSQILLWKQSIEANCHTVHDIFDIDTVSRADRIFASPSLILYHLSALNLYAPLQFFRGLIRKGEITQKDKSRLHEWARSSCARTATWNAAQICHIFKREFSSPATNYQLLQNPLASRGFADSILATCFFALHHQGCALCTDSTHANVVSLFDARIEHPKLLQWIENGEGDLVWGSDETPVCKCQITKLVNHIGETLQNRQGINARIISFFVELEKGPALVR